MIVRKADLERDAVDIADGARDFANRSPIKDLLTDDDKFLKALSTVVMMPNFEVLVAEHDDRVIGGIGIFYAPLLWNNDILTAEEHFWWVAEGAPFKTGITLINQAMKNIEERGAIPMFKLLSTSPKGVDKVYRRFGMKPVETLYMRRD
tara:strand:- start:869 stop:1315 length:447 start_codon:yes stop_codon:yes gene_type:complete